MRNHYVVADGEEGWEVHRYANWPMERAPEIIATRLSEDEAEAMAELAMLRELGCREN